MKEELCFGTIPMRKVTGGWQALVLRHRKGDYWGFPKGHLQDNEAPKEAAWRELEEESGLHVAKDLLKEFHEEYHFERDGKAIHKKVTYFLVEARGSVNVQDAEILEARWASLPELFSLLTFKGSLQIAGEVVKIFKNK